MTNTYIPKRRTIDDVRFIIARLLNRFFPRRFCWCDLVMWSLGERRWQDFYDPEDFCRNHEDVRATGTCYCGQYVTRERLADFEAKFGPSHTADWRIVD
jgi:ferredoxin-thioredoxin reductase catalytic subunit